MRGIKALVLASCVSLGGCLEYEQTVTLAADGSGSQVVHMVMRESVLALIERATPAAQLSAASNPRAVFDKQLVAKELRAAGLELIEHRVTRKAGLRSVDLKTRFADFASLQKSPLCGSSAEWVVSKGPGPGTGKLTLYPQGKVAWQKAAAKAKAMKGKPDPVAASFFKKRQKQLVGLDIAVRFRLPGDVIAWTANMEKTADREVTARITASQINTPEDLVRRLAPRFEVIFDATGCTLIN